MVTPVSRSLSSESARPASGAAAADFLRLAKEHYENFPVGSWLMPKAQRVHIHRIYAFARTADDIADELRDATQLAAYRREFLRHLDSDSPRTTPLFVDLAATIRECGLPVELFTALLDAFAQDLEVTRYERAAGLLDYCTKSADPVGRLVLRVFGHVDPQLDAYSDSICTALQLVNHLQDIGEDLRDRDRLYFPREDLVRHGVVEKDLLEPMASEGVRRLIRDWTDRTAAMLASGWPLMAAVRGRLRVELRAIVGGAAAVIRAIRAADHDVLAAKRRLSKPQQVRVLVHALLSSRLPRGLA